MAVDVTFLPGSSTNNINTNFQRVKEALVDVVGRSGNLPNQMNSDLDMNSNDILNVGLIDVGSITIGGKPIEQFDGTFRGDWDSVTTYFTNDVVRDPSGNLWIARKENTGVEVGENDSWTLFIPGSTVADGTVTRSKLADNLKLDADRTITVGTGGDFSTINDALKYASEIFTILYKPGGVNINVLLLAGFEMNEQVFVSNIDLSYITIVSVDPIVTIKLDGLTPNLPSPMHSGAAPAFACYNGVLPRIGCLFQMELATGTEEEILAKSDRRHGIYLWRSKAYVMNDCGITHAGGMGAGIYRQSDLMADYANFSYAQAWYAGGSEEGGTKDGAGIYAMNGSRVQANYANLQYGGDNGIYVNINSIADVRGANASYANRRGFYVNQGSTLLARDGIANFCGNAGVVNNLGVGAYVNRTSRAQLRDGQFNDCYVGIEVNHASSAWAESVTVTRSLNRNMLADRASIISASSATLTDAGNDGVSAQNGAVISISSSGNVSRAGRYGLHALSGGRIIADQATVNDTVNAIGVYAGYGSHIVFRGGITNKQLAVVEGGEIVAHNVTGTPTYSQAPNYNGPNGIIRTNNSYSLADDTAGRIYVGGKAAILEFVSSSSTTTSPRGFVWVDVGAPACQVISMASPNTNIAYTTGVLAGTTGTDGNFTISAATDGFVYFENRSGSARRLTVNVIGWTEAV